MRCLKTQTCIDSVYGNQVVFNSREETGKLLSEKLLRLQLKNPIVIAIPRGGVVVGCEIAKRIAAELDIIAPRKMPAPHNNELAIGAVMHDGSIFLNDEVIKASGSSPSYIEDEKAAGIRESSRRLEQYRGIKTEPSLEGRDVILVDDGVATGSTMEVAIIWIKKHNPSRLIVAIPVIPAGILAKLKGIVDRVVYVEAPENFYGISQFYRIFEQVDDKEIINMLQEFWKDGRK